MIPLLFLGGILSVLERKAMGLPMTRPRPGWFSSSRFRQRLAGTIVGIPILALILFLKSR